MHTLSIPYHNNNYFLNVRNHDTLDSKLSAPTYCNPWTRYGNLRFTLTLGIPLAVATINFLFFFSLRGGEKLWLLLNKCQGICLSIFSAFIWKIIFLHCTTIVVSLWQWDQFYIQQRQVCCLPYVQLFSSDGHLIWNHVHTWSQCLFVLFLGSFKLFLVKWPLFYFYSPFEVLNNLIYDN